MAGRAVTVEFFGIPRERTGVAAIELPIDGDSATLSNVLLELGRRFPELAVACLDDDRLRPQYAANLNGDRFVSDGSVDVHAGDSLLIMSADAGG